MFSRGSEASGLPHGIIESIGFGETAFEDFLDVPKPHVLGRGQEGRSESRVPTGGDAQLVELHVAFGGENSRVYPTASRAT